MAGVLLAAILALFAGTAHAAIGVMQIAGAEGDGKVTVFYPSSSEEQLVKEGPFSFRVARGGAPQRGNGRLVVISHGSGGVPAVHFDLARALVENGFVVAFPTHRGDNYNDPGTPGPRAGRAGRSRSRMPSTRSRGTHASRLCSRSTRSACTAFPQAGTRRSALRAADGRRRSSRSTARRTSRKTSSRAWASRRACAAISSTAPGSGSR